MNQLSPLVLPILASLIAFSIVGRSLTLWQKPSIHRSIQICTIIEYTAGLYTVLCILFKFPQEFRYVGYFIIVIAFCAGNWYLWHELFIYLAEDQKDAIAKITIERKTLGEIIREKQNITLSGQAHPEEEKETLTEVTKDNPPIADAPKEGLPFQ